MPPSVAPIISTYISRTSQHATLASHALSELLASVPTVGSCRSSNSTAGSCRLALPTQSDPPLSDAAAVTWSSEAFSQILTGTNTGAGAGMGAGIGGGMGAGMGDGSASEIR